MTHDLEPVGEGAQPVPRFRRLSHDPAEASAQLREVLERLARGETDPLVLVKPLREPPEGIIWARAGTDPAAILAVLDDYLATDRDDIDSWKATTTRIAYEHRLEYHVHGANAPVLVLVTHITSGVRKQVTQYGALVRWSPAAGFEACLPTED
jgi:hypothetical protein